MQSTIHHVGADEDNTDMYAPPETYYTTGKNAGGHVRRLKAFQVRL